MKEKGLVISRNAENEAQAIYREFLLFSAIMCKVGLGGLRGAVIKGRGIFLDILAQILFSVLRIHSREKKKFSSPYMPCAINNQ